MKKKNLPEAFPQIATADNFFRYGVPAPPSYYAFGGETALHKFTKKKGKSMPKAAAGMAMEDDPCPPDHYWDENQGKCIPFNKTVPSKEQFLDQQGPYYQYQDELNYRRNRSDHDEWIRQQKINWVNDNFKGTKTIDDENGIHQWTPEYEEFMKSDEYQKIKDKYQYLEEGTDNYNPEYPQQDFYSPDKPWDEKSKEIYNELFNTDDPGGGEDGRARYERAKIKERLYRQQHPEELIPERGTPEMQDFYKKNIKDMQITPDQIIKGNYDNWCPCTKKKVIDFVDGKPVMQDVCVPCEEMNTAQLGGSLAGVPVYPQAQTEAQFFTPTYHNSNNAYKVGGSYIEEFPQAQRLNWGPTNHFMLQEGGDIPQQSQGMMPQGMLPKMQSGNGLNGIMTKTRQDMQHYYGGNYPMLQEGGAPPDQGSSNFYSDRVNTFLDKVRSRAYEALPQQVEESALQEQEMAQYGYSGANMYNPRNVGAYKNAYESTMKDSQMANQDFMQGLNRHMDYNRYANMSQGKAAAQYGIAMKGGGELPQAKDGMDLLPDYKLNLPGFKKFDPYAVDKRNANDGSGGYILDDPRRYYDRSRESYYPNNYFGPNYHRDYMVDWSNATMNQLTGDALKNAQISGAETLTRRALLPGNRNAGVRLYFNGYGQPVAAPNGTNPGGGGTNPGGNTNPNGANTNPNGGNSTDPNDPGRPGFMGRLFGNRYNDSQFNVNPANAPQSKIDYSRLQSQNTPAEGSEYDAILNPNRANRVTNRMQRVGDKADRMHQYANMISDVNKKYEESDPTILERDLSTRARNRMNRLEDRYNNIATRHRRDMYTAPQPSIAYAYGGSLPRADYGIPPNYGFTPFNPNGFNPNFNPGSIEAPSMEQTMNRLRFPGADFTGGMFGNTREYDKPVAEGMVAPMDFSKDPTAATGKDKGFFVDILQGRQKKDRDPDFPIALTKFAANKIENARNPAKQEFARSTRADQVYGAVPTTSGSRGDYVMNTPAGQFFRPDDMNPWGKKNTGFNMPTAQYGGGQGDMVQNLKEGDEVYLTESQIQDIIKRGGKLSYL